MQGNVKAQYESKRTTPEELVRQFRSGNVIGLGVWYGEPYGVMKALDRLEPKPSPLYVFHNFTTCPLDVFTRRGLQCYNGFWSPYDRAAQVTLDNLHFMPVHFSTGGAFAREALEIDYFVSRVAPMDSRGHFNCSLTASYEYELIPWLKAHKPHTKIVLEVNPNMPNVFGLDAFGGNALPIDLADFIVEDASPLFEVHTPPATEVEKAIAANVAPLIEDKATVQIGFGTIPMAIGNLLADRRDLGIHSEMFCEAHIDLIEAGAVTNAHKGLYEGVATATFATGTKRLFDWLRENPAVAMLPVEEVNRVTVLARINKLVSVNSALMIDMCGQVCAHCIGPRTYSGLGGAFDFTYGAQLSPGGKSILCMPSTATLKDGRVLSNVVAKFEPGTRITYPEHVVDWIVTEFGAARLKHLTLEQRAKALIEIAHPAFREALAREFRDAKVDVARAESLPQPPAVFFQRGEVSVEV
ncbi:MAG: acetyl-CoA hydrolase/transferase C-terminal domain-containing protein [Candidatus Hydrogenedentales bacterium]